MDSCYWRNGETGLYLIIGSKVMTQMQKTQKMQKTLKKQNKFFTKLKKKKNEKKIFVFCFITFEPIKI